MCEDEEVGRAAEIGDELIYDRGGFMDGEPPEMTFNLDQILLQFAIEKFFRCVGVDLLHQHFETFLFMITGGIPTKMSD